jgi:hypothetical protein
MQAPLEIWPSYPNNSQPKWPFKEDLLMEYGNNKKPLRRYNNLAAQSLVSDKTSKT